MSWPTFSVNQHPGAAADFPFVSPSDDVRYLLGDFYLSYEDDFCLLAPPFRVDWLYGFGSASGAAVAGAPAPTHAKDVRVRDADDAVVFDTTTATAFSDAAWGTGRRTLQWLKDGLCLRCTMRTVPPPWDPSRAWKTHLAPADGALDARTYSRVPRHLRSVRVGLTRFTAGNVVFQEGYNVQIRQELDAEERVDGGRLVRRVTFRARPGDGLGRPGGCGDVDPVLRRVNTVEPTAGGDFSIDAGGCYRVQRPSRVTAGSPRRVEIYHAGLTEEKALSALQLSNDCGPCCECDDFVRTYEGIRRLDGRLRNLAARAEATRDVHRSNIARWEAQRACREANPMRLTVAAEQLCGLFVGGSHVNVTRCCAVAAGLPGLVLRTTFELFRGGSPLSLPAVVNKAREAKRSGSDTRYDEVPYTPEGPFPVYDHKFDFADPQGVSRFRNRLRLTGCVDGDVVRVTLSAHVPDLGVDCPMPTGVSIPAGVAALWATRPVVHTTRALVQKTVTVGRNTGCGGL